MVKPWFFFLAHLCSRILNRKYCFLYHLKCISLYSIYNLAIAILPTKITDFNKKTQLRGCFCINEAKLCDLFAVCSRLFFKIRIIAPPVASLAAPYSHPYHIALPHPEWNTPCEADLLLPYIRISSVLSFLQSLPCVRVSRLSLYAASFLTAIGMRYYHVPIAHGAKAWLSLSGQREADILHC